ncbi:MAG: hypothetical protein HDR43_01350 [Mycoplasma sp.]|nr:hypothetical protein [Mycoplasma sp.]
MKFLKRKIIQISSSIVILSPIAVAISCSTSNSFLASSKSNNLYSNIWNLSGMNEIKNTMFDMTIEELEIKINNELKKDSSNDFLMKIYSFYLLWQAIKSPESESGSSIQTNLSTDITNYSTFLSGKLVADVTNVDNENKEYKKFKSYLETFDYKISIVNFDGNKIDNKQTLRKVLYEKSYYVLNFKIDFWTTDDETNSKMISTKNSKSIMYKNALTRKQRETIKNIADEETKEIVVSQYSYQSTKMYYDIVEKKFSTIILPSNVHYDGKEETIDSGFSSNSKSRKLFLFDYSSDEKNPNNFSTKLILMLSSSNNFSTSISSDWTNFLEKEGYYGVHTSENTSKQMKNIEIDLGKSFYFNNSDY